MASEKGAVATGADHDSQATRRRNVPSSSSPAGELVNRVEIDEKKTQIKQVSDCYISPPSSPDHSIVEADVEKSQAQPSFVQFLDENEVWIAPLIFTFFAFFTRLYKIGLSDIVTWDEAQ
jgi:dolichyl-phosphate-mannose-protein mannosyltransferase